MTRPRNSNYTLGHKTGASEWMHYSFDTYWQHPVIIRSVMCPDGHYRTAYLGQDADTFFSWPARVRYSLAGVSTWHSGIIMAETVDGLSSSEPLHMRFHPTSAL